MPECCHAMRDSNVKRLTSPAEKAFKCFCLGGRGESSRSTTADGIFEIQIRKSKARPCPLARRDAGGATGEGAQPALAIMPVGQRVAAVDGNVDRPLFERPFNRHDCSSRGNACANSGPSMAGKFSRTVGDCGVARRGPGGQHSGGRSSLPVYENGKSVPVSAKLRANC
jgi:hypothetical protein